MMDQVIQLEKYGVSSVAILRNDEMDASVIRGIFASFGVSLNKYIV